MWVNPGSLSHLSSPQKQQQQKTPTKQNKKAPTFVRIDFKLDERGWIRMVEILGSPMENRTPFQEFALEGTGVMELLKGQAR